MLPKSKCRLKVQEEAIRGVLSKNIFLKISQYSMEIICVGSLFLGLQLYWKETEKNPRQFGVFHACFHTNHECILSTAYQTFVLFSNVTAEEFLINCCFILCFFYKNTLYKNIEVQILPKNKNKLRASWSSDQDLLKIRTHQVDIRMH